MKRVVFGKVLVGFKSGISRVLQYLAVEISNFCSQYFQSEVDTKSRDLGRNAYHVVESQHGVDVPELFTEDCGRPAAVGLFH